MDIQLCGRLIGRKRELWKDLIARSGLEPDPHSDVTVLIWEGEQLVAAGSRLGNLLKCIAVDEAHQGMDLTATVLTHLRQDAFEAGYSHLFLYTKPKNLPRFSALFFYPVAQTERVLLMESEPNGIGKFMASLPVCGAAGTVGALVMNCNPFTLGHRHVIQTAAKECDRVYVFVLSEEQPPFPAADRLMLVKEGVKDLSNVTVLPTGPYLLSAATFPTYFLPDREQATQVQCQLDIQIFTKYFIPKFGITRRYVGTEPVSPMTARYNAALKAELPIELREIPRLEADGKPISASSVRAALEAGELRQLRDLVPQTTLNYLTTFLKEN